MVRLKAGPTWSAVVTACAVAAGRWLVALLPLTSPDASAHTLPDPATDLVRVRVIVTTTAAAADVTVETGTIANALAGVTAGSERVRASVNGNRLRVSRNTSGRSAEAQFRLLLADVGVGRPVRWALLLEPPGSATIEIDNLNREDRPALVDRFTSDSPATFESPASAVRAGGPLTVTAFGRPLVLAHFYPWYTGETWSSPELLDRPTHPYSTDEPGDMARVVSGARAAGLDGLIVSWQGAEVGDGWNARRMELVLDAAPRVGLRVAAYLETLAANPEHVEGAVPTDPDTVFEWIAQILDGYGSHPACLRVGARPVVFVYAARRLLPAQWGEIADRLRANGRNPLLLGDSSELAWLDAFEGIYSLRDGRSGAGRAGRLLSAAEPARAHVSPAAIEQRPSAHLGGAGQPRVRRHAPERA